MKVSEKAVLEFWDYSCCVCLSTKKLVVHHRTYERVGNEALNDCVCLCQKCHRKLHGGMQDGSERAKQVPPDEVSLRPSKAEKYQNPQPPKEREPLDIKSLMKQPKT